MKTIIFYYSNIISELISEIFKPIQHCCISFVFQGCKIAQIMSKRPQDFPVIRSLCCLKFLDISLLLWFSPKAPILQADVGDNANVLVTLRQYFAIQMSPVLFGAIRLMASVGYQSLYKQLWPQVGSQTAHFLWQAVPLALLAREGFLIGVLSPF